MNDRLIEAGALLYGKRWQAEFARIMGVSRRTMVNWTNGVGEPSADHWKKIRGLLQAKAKRIAQFTAPPDAA